MIQYRPIIPWIGGKRRLAPHVLSKFGDHTCYVEAFAGGAAVFFMKAPSDVEVLNDVNGELVNLYRVVKHHLEEFVRQFKWALSSRQVYEWEQMTAPETLTDIQRAARFYYLQKLAFGGKVDGQTFGTATTSGPRLNLLRLEEDLSQAHLRLQSAYIEHLSWEQVVELARSIDGAMLISLNDHAEIRACFAGLHMETVAITYTVGGGRGSAARELRSGTTTARRAATSAAIWRSSRGVASRVESGLKRVSQTE